MTTKKKKVGLLGVLGVIFISLGLLFAGTQVKDEKKSLNKPEIPRNITVKRDLNSLGDIKVTEEKEIDGLKYLIGTDSEGNSVQELNVTESEANAIYEKNKNATSEKDMVKVSVTSIKVTEKNSKSFLSIVDGMLTAQVNAAEAITKINYWGKYYEMYKQGSNYVYCIEYGPEAGSGKVYTRSTNARTFLDKKYPKLSTAKIDRVERLAIHASYRIKANNNINYYASGSELIWETIHGGSKPHKGATTGTKSNLNTYVSEHAKNISLGVTSFTIKAGQTLTYTDKNDQLKYMTIENAADVKTKTDVTVTKSGKTLKFYKPVTSLKTATVTLQMTKYKGWFPAGSGYGLKGSSNYQDLAHFGYTTPIKASLTIRNTTAVGYIDGLKTGAEVATDGTVTYKPLAGAEFTVYRTDGVTKVASATTDANGYFKTIQISIGAYIVKETKAPTGYALNPTKYPVTVTEAKTVRINNGNPVPNDATALLTASKLLDGYNLYGTPVFTYPDGVAGKQKRLLSDNETYETGTPLYASQDGKKYFIKGEDTDSSLAIPYVTFDSLKAFTDGELYSKVGERIYYEIEPAMHMVDKLDENNKPVYKLDGNNDKIPVMNETEHVFATDSNGDKILLQGYSVNGSFVTTPDGIETINADGVSYTDDNDVTVYFYEFKYEIEQVEEQEKDTQGNLLYKYVLDANQDKVTKTMTAEYTNPSERVMEDRYNKVGITFVLKDSSGKVVQTVSTDKDGKFEFKNVLPGTYTVWETVTDTDFELPKGAIKTITVKPNSLPIDLGDGADIVNIPKSGTFEGKKVDAKTKEGLKGGEYSIYTKDNGTCNLDNPIETMVSNDEGLFSKDLAEGEYCVQETKAPNGYYLNDTVFDIIIKLNEVTPLTFENEVIGFKMLFNKVNEDNAPLKDAHFDFLLVADLNEDTSNLPATAEYGTYVDGVFVKGVEPASNVDENAVVAAEETETPTEEPTDTENSDDNNDAELGDTKLFRLGQFVTDEKGSFEYQFDSIMKLVASDGKARTFAVKETLAPAGYYAIPTRIFTIAYVDGKYVITENLDDAYKFEQTFKKPTTANDVVEMTIVDKEVKVDLDMVKKDLKGNTLENYQFAVSFSSLTEVPTDNTDKEPVAPVETDVPTNDDTPPVVDAPKEEETTPVNKDEVLTQIGTITTDSKGNAKLKLNEDNFPFEKDGTPKLIRIDELTKNPMYTEFKPVYFFIKYNVEDKVFETTTVSEKFTWDLKADDVVNSTVGFEVINKNIENKITVIKYSETEKSKLDGGLFYVYNKVNNQKVHEFKSKKEGVTFTLPYGEYYIREIEAPDGHSRLTKDVEFKVTEFGAEQTIKIGNKKILIPKAGNLGNYLWALVVIVAIGGTFAYSKRKELLEEDAIMRDWNK